MHMARLYDSGKMFGQYSLSALTTEYYKYIEPLVLAHAKRRRTDYMSKLNRESNPDTIK
jgi:hypothetical protein